MQNAKYRIDYAQKIEEFGRTLYRIVALANFKNVTTGDQGGYIESERNLSQYDSAWVYDNARIFGNARVHGNARVYGNAKAAKFCATVRTSKYHCTISDTHIAIGCKNYTFSEWENFTEEEIRKMDTNAWEWWTQYKPILFEILKAGNK